MERTQRPKKVFISYVNEDAALVEKLEGRMRAAGLDVWRDANSLHPGQLWRREAASAIQSGAAFVACFSHTSEGRELSEMRWELRDAVDVLNRRPLDREWFFPVKLTPCEIPPYEIGYGRTLGDIQWADLTRDFELGAQRLIQAIGKAVGVRVSDELEGWRRFNWIPGGAYSEARVSVADAGLTIEAPERTYNGLFGLATERPCGSRLSCELLIERPARSSAGYGVGIVPRGRLDDGVPHGVCFEVGWHELRGGWILNVVTLPDGPWSVPETTQQVSSVSDGRWFPFEVQLDPSSTRLTVGRQRVDAARPLPQDGGVLLRAWGSTARIRNISFGC